MIEEALTILVVIGLPGLATASLFACVCFALNNQWFRASAFGSVALAIPVVGFMAMNAEGVAQEGVMSDPSAHDGPMLIQVWDGNKLVAYQGTAEHNGYFHDGFTMYDADGAFCGSWSNMYVDRGRESIFMLELGADYALAPHSSSPEFMAGNGGHKI